MKHLLLFGLSLLFTINSSAQSFIDKHYSSYGNREDATRISIGSKAFSMFNTFAQNSKDQETKEINKVVSKIKSFDMLVVEKVENPMAEFKKGLNDINGFEELIKVKSNDANVSIQINETNNVIHEIVGLIASDNEFIVFNLVGEISMDEMGQIMSQVDEQNISKVLKSKNLQLGDVKMYPNPVKQGEKVTVQVPESMKGGTAILYDVDGKKISEYKIEGDSIEVETYKLKNSTHLIKFQNNGTTYTRKLIVTE
jgi:hypothetical protein